MQNDFCHPDGWLAHIGVDVMPARAAIAPLQRLLPVLRSADVPIFAGVNADQCVMVTLQDAHFLGYDCILIEDCTATTSPDFCWQATLYNVNQCFGFVAHSQPLLTAIQTVK